MQYLDPTGKRAKASADKIIVANKEYIFAAAEKFEIDPVILASIIYAEQCLNVNWVDDLLDGFLGFYGIDTSVGIAQVKISTAKFLEEKGYMPSITAEDGGWSIPGIGFIHGTENMAREKALENPSINIMYAAAYIRYFQDLWAEAFPDISTSTDILAALYNLGHEQTSPNENPTPNPFGVFAREQYSFLKELLGIT